ncbi:MAG: hypothetical protein CL846_09845 [Crocinitomicaceae bacterium]|nr:hypothetical protein [Crocinitomicaceae bacterium]|tara:strand:- start:235 stop:708 length:474 start_codon:yes stop_codon:yes gene_type:complete
MKKIDALLDEYGESHQNKTNKLIHWICVPLIYFSIVGLVRAIPFDLLSNFSIDKNYLNWASISIVLVMIYYLTMSFQLTIGMSLFSILCLFICNKIILLQLSILWISVIVFIVAWIFQFIGHNIEGKKPSFLRDLQFLLIGPAWLMHFIYKKLNIKY